MIRSLRSLAVCAGLACSPWALAEGPYPILFVTQVPTAGYQNLATAFGAHWPSLQQAPRGGDLWIRYPDGTMRNLTQEAGFGVPGDQSHANAIAVRQPSVHFNGRKALFSMLVGAPTKQYEVNTSFRWQLYEVDGLAKGATATIERVKCQPGQYNNLAPFYASDGQVVFVSDRPRGGQAHLYPQRDEYESAPIDTGLWKLDRKACTVRIIEHAPSGVTYPSLDSAGRILFTKWDHLQRDQQADSDTFHGGEYGTFNYTSESHRNPPAVHSRAEVFPELRSEFYSKLPGQGYTGDTIAPDYPFNGHTFNQFFPWMVNQDGSGEETLNHVGRHEIGGTYTDGSHRADEKLHYAIQGALTGGTFFLRGDGGMFHLREDPLVNGRFYGTRAPEFSTATSGDIVRLDGGPGVNPESMKLVPVALSSAALGRLRNPLPTSDGQLLVVHTGTTDNLKNDGTTANPSINYAFRLRYLNLGGAEPALGDLLTPGIAKSISYWNPDTKVTWSGTLWELDPVEVRSRPVPPLRLQEPLPRPERRALERADVDPELLRNWLHARQLALVVSRNVTQRDRGDQQQPFNLGIPGGTKTLEGNPSPETPPDYEVTHIQFFQADQIRGYASPDPPQQGGTVGAGRRVLAQAMHDPAALDAMGGFASPAIAGATKLGMDGSMAAFVPAQRAMTWQLVDAKRTGWDRAVVRERNWLSFKPGEMRVCASCHGVNVEDQAGAEEVATSPEALTTLARQWKKVIRNGCDATGGTGAWSYDGVAFSPWEDGRRYRIQACQGGNGCCDGMPATETQLQ
ncbi:MAG TPA: hypothetical protein VJM11_07265 [Nevskiaceae bacterium]|nr:hypothetical protein [Nevskiaceae bacterium]